MKANYEILDKGVEITTFEGYKFFLKFDKRYIEPSDKFSPIYQSIITINTNSIQSNYTSEMGYGEQHVYLNKFLELHPYSEYYKQLQEINNES